MNFNFNKLCEYCLPEDLDEFTKEEVHDYGNFDWIDFEDVKSLDLLNPQEVAELLYLANFK